MNHMNVTKNNREYYFFGFNFTKIIISTCELMSIDAFVMI